MIKKSIALLGMAVVTFGLSAMDEKTNDKPQKPYYFLSYYENKEPKDNAKKKTTFCTKKEIIFNKLNQNKYLISLHVSLGGRYHNIISIEGWQKVDEWFEEKSNACIQKTLFDSDGKIIKSKAMCDGDKDQSTILLLQRLKDEFFRLYPKHEIKKLNVEDIKKICKTFNKNKIPGIVKKINTKIVKTIRYYKIKCDNETLIAKKNTYDYFEERAFIQKTYLKKSLSTKENKYSGLNIDRRGTVWLENKETIKDEDIDQITKDFLNILANKFLEKYPTEKIQELRKNGDLDEKLENFNKNDIPKIREEYLKLLKKLYEQI